MTNLCCQNCGYMVEIVLIVTWSTVIYNSLKLCNHIFWLGLLAPALFVSLHLFWFLFFIYFIVFHIQNMYFMSKWKKDHRNLTSTFFNSKENALLRYIGISLKWCFGEIWRFKISSGIGNYSRFEWYQSEKKWSWTSLMFTWVML